MEKIKNCLGLILMGLCCAYTVDGVAQDAKDSKQMIIIKKSVDENGEETVMKKVFSGDEISDQEMETIMTDDGSEVVDVWISKNTDETDLDTEEHDLVIFTADDAFIDKFLAKNNLTREDIETIDISVDSSIENGEETVVKNLTIIDKKGNSYQTDMVNGGKQVRAKGPAMQFDYVPSKPKLGVMVENHNKGAMIVEVIPESPAANAGLQEGDIIYGIGEVGVKNSDDLISSLSSAEGKIFVAFFRDGKAESKWVTLSAFEFKSGSKEIKKERVIIKN